MIIVSDTTPLSELAKVGEATLLHKIYGEIIIPRQVSDELMMADILTVVGVLKEPWLKVKDVSQPALILKIQTSCQLGLGECAAFILAKELKADRLLIDDLAARKEAIALGLPIIGTLGILLIAKKRKVLTKIKPILDDLITNGTRISNSLYQEILHQAEE